MLLDTHSTHAMMAQLGFATSYKLLEGFALNGYALNGYAQNGYAQNGYAQNGYAQNGCMYYNRMALEM